MHLQVEFSLFCASSQCGSSSLSIILVAISSGTTIDTKLGISSVVISCPVLTLSPIHSIMVVTSPIGENAPPLLAAITITLEKIQRSFCFFKRQPTIVTIIIVVVRLSRTADMKKVTNAIIQSSFLFFLAVMVSVMMLNPPYRSITSTMVIALMRKIRISHVSPSCSSTLAFTSVSPDMVAYIAQSSPHIISANVPLLVCRGCSQVIRRYPTTNIAMRRAVISYKM